MTTTQTTDAQSPTWIADNIAATIVDHGTFDGKRGNTWTPADGARGYWGDLKQYKRDEDPRALTLYIRGEVTRGDHTFGYSPNLEIRFSRWQHGFDAPGCWWDVFPPYERLPEAARVTIAAAVTERVTAALHAVFGGFDTQPAPVAVFDDIYREAAREKARYALDRARDEARRSTEHADKIAARLADPEWTPYADDYR